MGRSKQARRSLFLYTLVVATGLKDAYLVDACSLTENDAKLFIRDFTERVSTNGGVMASNVLGVVTLGLDVFIVNMQRWRIKLSTWAQSKTENVVIIDLTRDHPCLALEELHSKILLELHEFASEIANLSLPVAAIPTTYSLNIEQDDQIFRQLGGPCLAGLLLGYPIVYYLPGTSTEVCAHGSNLLSHTMLVKFTSQVTIRYTDVAIKSSVWSCIKEYATENSISVNLLEFTVPAILSPPGDGVEWCDQQLCLEERRDRAVDLLAGCSLTCNVQCVSFMSDTVSL
ncbi:DUF4504 domain-containing protein [archaeon]|nr:MAG: DUF4504 domain-containing protein [archaeon]